MINKLFGTPKLRFLYSLLIFQIALYTTFRILFLIYFKDNITSGLAEIITKNLWLGARFDSRLAMVGLIPAIIFINLPLNPAFKIRLMNWVYSIFFSLICFLYVVDIGHFGYLNSRLNATIISFITNPIMSFEMVQESHSWPVYILVILILSLICFFILKKKLTPNLIASPLVNNNRTRFTGGFLFFILFWFGLYGSLKMYPLRWSEAFATSDTFASSLSLNPILYIADTYAFRNPDFEKAKVQENYQLVAKFLGVDKIDPAKLNFLRSFPGDLSKNKMQPNVVVIVMESMAWFKTGIGGSLVNPTPNLDQLAGESLLFNHFFTPTLTTARSIFAALTSLPDISKIKTGPRNPIIVNQNTIMGQFKGYEKFYFLGGSTSRDSIRGFFTFNVPNLNIIDESSHTAPRVDIWGISDFNLFKAAHERINLDRPKNKKPFFAFIQSSGFQRPYTIPEDKAGFVIKTPKDISESEIRAFGFESFEEYNSMRLQDFSLGQFFKRAKKAEWYNNTIFVVFGDHGLPHNNAKNVANWKKHMANNYHVPFIIHSPGLIKSGIETKVASELDLMPTLAGLAGIAYKTRGLGRDLFNPKFDEYRAAFSYNWNAPFHISLIDKDFYFEYITNKGEGKLVKYDEYITEDLNVKEQYPEKYREMEALTKGLYESAKYLLHNNPKMD